MLVYWKLSFLVYRVYGNLWALLQYMWCVWFKFVGLVRKTEWAPWPSAVNWIIVSYGGWPILQLGRICICQCTLIRSVHAGKQQISCFPARMEWIEVHCVCYSSVPHKVHTLCNIWNATVYHSKITGVHMWCSAECYAVLLERFTCKGASFKNLCTIQNTIWIEKAIASTLF